MKISILFFILGIMLIFSLCTAGAKNVTIAYPANVTAGQVFQANLTLIDFSEGLYDVKIDITNSSDDSDRLSKIFNAGLWQTTYDYVINATNTSASNSSIFSMNITKNYNGTGNITVKIRKSGVVDTFSGYSINITPVIPNNSACIQNWSCSAWGSCNSGTQTRSCQDTNNCNNNSGKPAESQACTTPSSGNTTISLDWNDDDMINGNNFTITVNTHNLQNDYYDLKLWIEFDENTTIISERFDENSSKWKSGTYYVNEFFSGPGDLSKDIDIRINTDYSGFYGDAKIRARLRKNGDIVSETSKYIAILKGSSTSSSTSSNSESDSTTQASANDANSASNSSSSPEIIILGGSKKTEQKEPENSIIYKSKNERIKEYTPYFFGGICVFLIILLIAERSKSAVKDENLMEEIQKQNQ